MRKVLIVEDSDACAAALEIALLSLGDITVVPVTARDALRILSGPEQTVCAVITDLQMPRIDGFELIQRIRAEARHAGLPILVLSGDTDPGTPERVRGLGANAYFAKPYSPIAVRQALERLIHVHS